MTIAKLANIKTINEDLVIPRGVDYQQLFTIIDRDDNAAFDFTTGTTTGITSIAIGAKIKQYPGDVSFAGTFSVAFQSQTNGIIKISLTDTQVDKLKRGRYFYDVLVTLENKPDADEAGDLHSIRVAQGQIIVE